MAATSCPSPGTLWFMFPSNLCLNEPETTLGFLSLRENRIYMVKEKNVSSDVTRGFHNMSYSVQSNQSGMKVE